MSRQTLATQLALVLALALGACAGGPASSVPTPTVTVVPFSTPTGLGTEAPGQAAAPECNPNDGVDALGPLVPYDEFSLSQNTIEGVRNLNLWFVDPGLDPLASGGAIEENVSVARLHATRLAHLLNQGDGCVASVFQGITALAVDRDYNAWFTGQIVPGNLPQAADPTDGDLEAAAETFTAGYTRTSETLSASRPAAEPGSCLWPEVRESLLSHFGDGRQNLAFYISVDDDGVNVWGQWDGPADFDILQGNLLSLRAELGCLHPPLDTFWTVYVDGTGATQLVLAVAGDAVRASTDEEFIDQLEIIYPST